MKRQAEAYKDSEDERSARTPPPESQNHALILETANRVALDILSNRTGVEALRHIAEAARTLADASYAALGVARRNLPGAHNAGTILPELVEFITVGITPAEETELGAPPSGRGVLGLLLECENPLRIDVLKDHPASVGFPPNHPPMDTFLGVPIRSGDTVLGSLYLTNKLGGGPFTEADELAVQALGAHAAIAIHNMQMLSRQRALVNSLITAQEEERRAVAHDLHDGLTQYIMGAHAHLETFRSAHQAGKPEKAARELERGLEYLKQGIIESRRLINGLRTLALDDLGLVGALEQLLADEKARAGWEKTNFTHNITTQRFDKALETAVYRVIQEALTNTRKHACANKVRLVLRMEKNRDDGAQQLKIEVRDWGLGFDRPGQLHEQGHFGLQGMAERVRLFGGAFKLESEPGQGTILEATLPVPDG